jgi:hypothetical protein
MGRRVLLAALVLLSPHSHDCFLLPKRGSSGGTGGGVSGGACTGSIRSTVMGEELVRSG